jgi:hypothetical protein
MRTDFNKHNTEHTFLNKFKVVIEQNKITELSSFKTRFLRDKQYKFKV